VRVMLTGPAATLAAVWKAYSVATTSRVDPSPAAALGLAGLASGLAGAAEEGAGLTGTLAGDVEGLAPGVWQAATSASAANAATRRATDRRSIGVPLDVGLGKPNVAPRFVAKR
jgi:hypothetical protein